MSQTKLDTSYKSDLYYDVVIKSGSYKGYSTNYVGIGGMRFIHNEKENIWVSSQSDNWMEECWNEFIEITRDNK